MHERGVSTLEPNRQEAIRNHEVAWGSFYDFAVAGAIPTDVDQLDSFHAYAQLDAYERCGEPGTASYEWFAHKGGGYIRESDLASAQERARRQNWLLDPEELAYNKSIASAQNFHQLPENLRGGIRPTADTPQMFEAIRGCAEAKVRLHNSIRVRELWEERPRNIFRPIAQVSSPKPDQPLQMPRRYNAQIRPSVPSTAELQPQRRSTFRSMAATFFKNVCRIR